jgi:hypothetical protein
MCARSKPPDVGEIQILSNQESLGVLRRIPNFRIGLPGQGFLWNRINIVPELSKCLDEPRRQVRRA